MSLKELNFDNLKFTKCLTGLGTIYNLNNPIEFQTPCVKITEIDNDYITLQILPTQACKIFFLKIHEFEQTLKTLFVNQEVIGLFDGSFFKIKVKNNKNFKIYLNGNLFNFYHLRPGDQVLLLVSISKLWDNGTINYNLNIHEMVLKER